MRLGGVKIISQKTPFYGWVELNPARSGWEAQGFRERVLQEGNSVRSEDDGKFQGPALWNIHSIRVTFVS